MHSLQGVENFEFAVLVEWIKVRPDRSREQNRVLRNNRQPAAQIVQFDFRYVDSVNVNTTPSCFQKPEQRASESVDFPAPVRPTTPTL